MEISAHIKKIRMSNITLLAKNMQNDLRRFNFARTNINDSKYSVKNTPSSVLRYLEDIKGALIRINRHLDVFKVCQDSINQNDQIIRDKARRWNERRDEGPLEVLAGILKVRLIPPYDDYYPAERGTSIYKKGDKFVIHFANRRKPANTLAVEYKDTDLNLKGKIDFNGIMYYNN